MKRILILFVVALVSPLSFADDAKDQPELRAEDLPKIEKFAQNPMVLECVKYYEFDFFFQALMGGSESVPKADRKAQLDEFERYLDAGHLVRRPQLAAEPVPAGLEEKCNTVAQAQTEVAAIQVSMLEKMIPKFGEAIGKALGDALGNAFGGKDAK